MASSVGTAVEDVDEPEVSSIAPGAVFVVTSFGTPLVQTHAIRYQKLFCIFMAPPVVNSNLSQSCAIEVRESITSLFSIVRLLPICRSLSC